MTERPLARIARISAGIGLVILGIFLLVLPGPGILTIIAGLALLARDVPALQRVVDRLRERFAPDEEEA